MLFVAQSLSLGVGVGVLVLLPPVLGRRWSGIESLETDEREGVGSAGLLPAAAALSGLAREGAFPLPTTGCFPAAREDDVFALAGEGGKPVEGVEADLGADVEAGTTGAGAGVGAGAEVVKDGGAGEGVGEGSGSSESTVGVGEGQGDGPKAVSPRDKCSSVVAAVVADAFFFFFFLCFLPEAEV